jgi:hypothetical protein
VLPCRRTLAPQVPVMEHYKSHGTCVLAVLHTR